MSESLCFVLFAARTQLLRIHEVSQQEYNDLLRLTRGGSQVSESRLLRSSLGGLASSYIPSLFSDGNKQSSAAKRYPLCVVSSQDRDEKYGRHITWKLGGSDDEDKFEFVGGQGHGHGHGGSYDDDDDTDKDKDDEAGRPIVNCIVVVKGDKDEEHDSSQYVVPIPKPGSSHVDPKPDQPGNNYDYPTELWKWYQKYRRWLNQFPCDPKVQTCP